jgi:hypothetical protein
MDEKSALKLFYILIFKEYLVDDNYARIVHENLERLHWNLPEGFGKFEYCGSFEREGELGNC